MRRVRISLNEAGLAAYVAGQLNAMFPDGRVVNPEALREALPAALDRLEHCFARVNNKYFFDGQSVVFSHLHGDQYSMFLYLVSNVTHRMGVGDDLPTKVFLLNKALHGIDAFYEVELPTVFLFVHPLGTVLGRGRYSDYFLAYQRCGIGSNHEVYPELGEFLTLRPGSAVLGSSRIGRNCTIATESLVLDRDLPEGSVYIGNPRDFTIRPAAGVLPIWRI